MYSQGKHFQGSDFKLKNKLKFLRQREPKFKDPEVGFSMVKKQKGSLPGLSAEVRTKRMRADCDWES